MTWRIGEVWLDADLTWAREQPVLAAAGAADVLDLPRFGPAEPGLEASRRRRLAARTARKRRLATRAMPAFAVVVGSATTLSIAALRHREGGADVATVLEDPPSLTFGLDDFGFR